MRHVDSGLPLASTQNSVTGIGAPVLDPVANTGRRRNPLLIGIRVLAVPVAVTLGLGLLPTVAQAAPVPSGPAPSLTTAAVSAQGAKLIRIATFNVRTARATGDSRTWLKRAPDVAHEIMVRRVPVVLLQELGPGRADGRTGTLQGHARQTDSLMSALRKQGGSYYRLVRNTSYYAPGTVHGTQGARILYDSRIVSLVSRCSNMTGTHTYSGSCAFDLPIAAGDGKKMRRSAAYAELKDRRTGHRFFAVSAHLDSRHSKNNTTEARYTALRAAQARFIAAKVARANPAHRPVVFGADLNSWRQDRGNWAAHRVMKARGFRDAAMARTRVNYAYASINHFDTTMVKSKNKLGGVHLDVVMTKGAKGVTRYENKMARVDSSRPSDHNMVLADVLL